MLTLLLSLRARNNLNTPPHVFLKLERATRQGTLKVLLNRHSRACGYLAYAKLNKESFSRFRHHGKLPENAWEWDEGHLVVVADCMWKSLSLVELRRQLRDAVGYARVVAYERGGVIKIWLRRNKLSHFSERIPVT